jgi:peptidyl-prolyl cis-trans isomerase SurA
VDSISNQKLLPLRLKIIIIDKQMKKIFILLQLSMATFGATAQKAIADRIAANVGDEYVLLSDVEEAFASAKDQKTELPAQYRCMVLDNIMMQKLLTNQARLDSIPLKDEEVETQLNARIEQILRYMNGNLQQFVEYYGITPDEMKNTMREDMRGQMLAERMRGKVLSDVTVTPSEVKRFFAKIPKDSLPYFNQEVEVAEIVFKPKPNAVEKASTFKRMQEIRQKIVDGTAKFEDLAKKHSADPGSGREGGDLGFAKRGTYVPEFEAAAYKLEEKEISPVTETEFGYHIIQMLERRGNNIHVRHILLKPEITYDDMKLARKTLDSVRLRVMSDSMRFSEAVKRFGDKGTQSYHNDGRLTNHTSGTTNFETRELDPAIYFAIDTMKTIGGITEPIEFTMVQGEKAFRVVKLLSRTSPHKANLEQDYNKIQLATVEQKKNEYLIKWISDKINSTYVTFDKTYQHCPNLSKWQAKKARP